MRILRAQIDVALRRAHRDAGDRHALDERERIAFHEHAIGERAGVAFVGIADHVFLVGLLIEHRLPLDAGGERRAAATTQAGVGDFLHDLRATHRQRAPQARITAVRHVLLEIHRIDDADAREGQTFLLRDDTAAIVHRTQPQRMGGTLQQCRPSPAPATSAALTGP